MIKHSNPIKLKTQTFAPVIVSAFLVVCLILSPSAAYAQSSYLGLGGNKSAGFKTHTAYESRRGVLAKAAAIEGGQRGCKKLLIGPWKLIGPLACQGEKAYRRAALKQCKMKLIIVTNSNSQYSFDKSRTKFIPYACKR